MEPGVYVTFFDKDEPESRELPPVGPLDHVVLRLRGLIADRVSVHQSEDMSVPIARWLEAEIELQRFTGEEPGGPRRTGVRVASPDGVFMRFGVYGETREHDFVPELGPFAVVVVAPRGVLGDGVLLAMRPPSELAPWELTSSVGQNFAGMHKPDLAFRTPSTPYHAAMTPALQPGALPRPRVQPSTVGAVTVPAVPAALPEPAVPAPAAPAPAESLSAAAPVAPVADPSPAPAWEERAVPPPSAPAPEEPTQVFVERRRGQVEDPTPGVFIEKRSSELTEGDRELIERIEHDRAEETLRARIHEAERARGTATEVEDDTRWAARYRPQAMGTSTSAEVEEEVPAGGLSFAEPLWRMRFAIIGVLVLGIGLYGLITLRTGASPGVQSQVTAVSVSQTVNGPRFDYTVNSIQRLPTSGSATARGTFVIVRVFLTARTPETQRASPSDFALVDANGTEYAPESLESDAYVTNPQVAWPASFPGGRKVLAPIVFDTASGTKLLLVIRDVPSIRVRLD